MNIIPRVFRNYGVLKMKGGPSYRLRTISCLLAVNRPALVTLLSKGLASSVPFSFLVEWIMTALFSATLRVRCNWAISDVKRKMENTNVIANLILLPIIVPGNQEI